ncbi:hypothetical protein [Methanosarcina horonobensis]|nr:hypothetical protein [Methanosarcina horonobensis]
MFSNRAILHYAVMKCPAETIIETICNITTRKMTASDVPDYTQTTLCINYLKANIEVIVNYPILRQYQRSKNA